MGKLILNGAPSAVQAPNFKCADLTILLLNQLPGVRPVSLHSVGTSSYEYLQAEQNSLLMISQS